MKLQQYTQHFPDIKILPGHIGQCHSERMRCLFHSEKIVATESVLGATKIVALFIGNEMQLPVPDLELGLPTIVFAKNTLGGGIRIKDVQVGQCITFWVLNESDVSVEWSVCITGVCA